MNARDLPISRDAGADPDLIVPMPMPIWWIPRLATALPQPAWLHPPA